MEESIPRKPYLEPLYSEEQVREMLIGQWDFYDLRDFEYVGIHPPGGREVFTKDSLWSYNTPHGGFYLTGKYAYDIIFTDETPYGKRRNIKYFLLKTWNTEGYRDHDDENYYFDEDGPCNRPSFYMYSPIGFKDAWLEY